MKKQIFFCLIFFAQGILLASERDNKLEQADSQEMTAIDFLDSIAQRKDSNSSSVSADQTQRARVNSQSGQRLSALWAKLRR